MKHLKSQSRGLAANQANMISIAALGAASGQVIAQRLARAAGGDHGEAGLMVREKLGASALSGVALLQHGLRMALGMSGFALGEGFHIARASRAMAMARTPAAAWQAQMACMTGSWSRWIDQSAALGAALAVSGGAALKPVHRVAAANARRLGR